MATTPNARQPHADRARGLLARLRIRKKLIVLHTAFSLVLACMLWVILRPAIGHVVARAEATEAILLLEIFANATAAENASAYPWRPPEGAAVRHGDPESLGLTPADEKRLRALPSRPLEIARTPSSGRAAIYLPPDESRPEIFALAEATIPEARKAVWRLYALLVAALLGVYALVALALEALVLPRHVYRPIRQILLADQAVQQGRSDEELIPDRAMPADELGEIMRSRNESITKLRGQGKALADALERLEAAASDLAVKNNVLERARQNLADADRLVSLGMMSAGLAHELNTPLAVIKGLAERLNADPRAGLSPEQAALMLRVVARLERLSEGLLDFARARPPTCRQTALHSLVEEAVTLVRLDREARDTRIVNLVPVDLTALCDGDRMVQVLVNLIRNAVDAIDERPHSPNAPQGLVEVRAASIERDGEAWLQITITDNGPGLAPEVLARLFEPFVSTRLDARGTGLGLAVAEGIVREHGGVMLAHNHADRQGATFEILLPADTLIPQPHPQRDGHATDA
ncbi:MAG: hypothetical protein KF866_00595 [Phycisphaeraceae bacterium]|nr:hypothetical protein [Phycisphaeraceae bacterium]MCW5755157.1 hypothetical protein [Phycisphaeraceae bacterium]